MEKKKQNLTKMNRALRDCLLEASEGELREALSDTGQDFDSLAARGRAAAQRALTKPPDVADV